MTTRYRHGLSTDDLTLTDDLTVAGDTTISGTLSPAVSNSTALDFSVNTTMFTVEADNGNTAIAGTLAVTGASTLTGAVSCGSTLATTGAATLASLVCTAAGTFGGGYGATGVTISTAGNIQANGTLTVDGASTLTGNVTASGTLEVTGASTLTGAVSCGSTLASTGAATLASLVCTAGGTFGGGYGSTGCTIATTGNIQTNGTLTVDGTSTLTGNVTITGSCEVTGGFTCDTSAFVVANTTGVVTLINGATIDNNADAAVLNLTETTVRVTGILDVTGNSTLASLDVGGGSGGSGATITAAGAATFDGMLTATGGITLQNGGTIANAVNGTIVITEPTVQVSGILDVTGNSTLASLDVGGGSGGTGATITAAGAATFDGMLTATGGITLANGGTITNAVNGTIVLTEPTIQVAGILDVTGNSTLASLDVGGGSGGSGATITAAGAATFDGAVTCSSTLAVTGAATFTAACKTGAGLGGAAGTGVTAVEYGDGNIHKTVFTFTNVDLALTDQAGVIAYSGLKVYDFPAGAILFLGATTDFDLTKSSAGVNADWDGDIAVGTVTAAGDADLTGTEANIIPKTATPQAVAGATTGNAQSTATQNAVVDGTTTAVDAFVNLLVDDADHDVTSTPCNIIVNGTMTIAWINLGDY